MVKKPLKKAFPREVITLGDQIRSHRLKLNLLQEEVANIIGVSRRQLNSWENNKANPQRRILENINKFLHL